MTSIVAFAIGADVELSEAFTPPERNQIARAFEARLRTIAKLRQNETGERTNATPVSKLHSLEASDGHIIKR